MHSASIQISLDLGFENMSLRSSAGPLTSPITSLLKNIRTARRFSVARIIAFSQRMATRHSALRSSCSYRMNGCVNRYLRESRSNTKTFLSSSVLPDKSYFSACKAEIKDPSSGRSYNVIGLPQVRRSRHKVTGLQGMAARSRHSGYYPSSSRSSAL
jgi:hypothetical protein